MSEGEADAPRARVAWWDLALVVVLAASACAGALLLGGAIRLLILVPLLLAPGYALAAGIFPYRAHARRTGGLTSLERIGASFLFSFALLPVAVYMLEGAGVRFSLLALSLVSLAATTLAALFAWRQRVGAPSRTRYAGGALALPASALWRWARTPRRAAIVAAALASLATCVIVVAGLGPPTDFVEATLVPPSGTLSDLPTNASVGSTARFDVVLRSHHADARSASLVLVHERGTLVAAGERGSWVPAAEERAPQQVDLLPLTNATMPLSVTFQEPGLHRISVEVDAGDARPLRLQWWVEVR